MQAIICLLPRFICRKGVCLLPRGFCSMILFAIYQVHHTRVGSFKNRSGRLNFVLIYFIQKGRFMLTRTP